MPETESNLRTYTRINLFLPGGGLILSGRVLAGLTTGLLFVAAAALAIDGNLIAPHRTPRTLALLTIGLTIGLYIAAQIRMSRAAREARDETRIARRRAEMIEAHRALDAEDFPRAKELLLDLQRENPADLHVAYRLAQLAIHTESPETAREAWRRLRMLDKHRIYKSEIADNLNL
ncbi:MAG: hypothetical protein AB7N71_05970 [Phycisphaerae bacterium]